MKIKKTGPYLHKQPSKLRKGEWKGKTFHYNRIGKIPCQRVDPCGRDYITAAFFITLTLGAAAYGADWPTLEEVEAHKKKMDREFTELEDQIEKLIEKSL